MRDLNRDNEYKELPPYRIIDRRFKNVVLKIILLSIFSVIVSIVLIVTLVLNLIYISNESSSSFKPFSRFVPWTVIIWFTGFTLICLTSWKNYDFFLDAQKLYRLKNKKGNIDKNQSTNDSACKLDSKNR